MSKFQIAVTAIAVSACVIVVATLLFLGCVKADANKQQTKRARIHACESIRDSGLRSTCIVAVR